MKKKRASQSDRKRTGDKKSEYRHETDGDVPMDLSELEQIHAILRSPPTSLRGTLLSLLAAIATEELALAHMINVEAEKTEAVAHNLRSPFTPEEVIEFQQSVCNIIAQVTKKEEILLKKLRLIVSLLNEDNEAEDEKDFTDDDFDQDDEMDSKNDVDMDTLWDDDF